MRICEHFYFALTKRSGKRAIFRGTLYIPALFSALISFIAYLPSLKSGFVNWDDPDYVAENPLVRLADLEALKGVFSTVVSGNWHPLTVLSLALDYRLWGMDPFGYHLTNVILHALNSALVYLVTRRLIKEKTDEETASVAAFTTAVLFGIHPAHVESVAWIAERKDVLSAFFFLLSVLSYLRYSRTGSAARYAASLILFIPALLSKPMAVTLPVVLLILDFYPLERISGGVGGVKRVLVEKAPFFALSAVSSALTLWAQKAGGAIVPYEAYPFYFRAAIAVRALFFYLYKMILPFDLAPFYPMPERADLFNSFFVLSAVVFAAVTVFCALTFRRQRLVTSVWAYYLVTLSPVIGIIQVGSQAAADRYTYIPGIGPFMLAGLFAGLVYERAPRALLKVLCALVIAAVLTALSAVTLRQEAVWRDSVTLWTHEIKAHPNVSLAYNNRGLAYNDLYRFAEAVEDFGAALRLRPDYAEAYNNRGISYEGTRDYPRAIEDYRTAIRINPGLGAAYHNLGLAYSAAGEDALAFEMLQKARALGYRPKTP